MTRLLRRMRGGDFHLNIIGRARFWFVVSAVFILLSVALLTLRGINAGLEFKGGTALRVQAASSSVTVAQVRQAVQRGGVPDPTVQKIGTRGFQVETRHLEPDEQNRVASAIATTAGVERNDVDVHAIGPKWGRQITNKAIRALLIFLVVVALYMSVRLEPKMAAAALISVVHDLVITAGIYSLSGFVVTPATVIALLTVLGYSLYDTVVIFDRIRERTRAMSATGNMTYSEVANESVNQVLMRSLNTSVTGLLPVGSLLFVGSFLLGAQTLRELALALFIGLAASTYSSIFVATPVLAIWKEREERWQKLRARVAARRGGEPIPSAPPARSVTAQQAPVTSPVATMERDVITPPPSRMAAATPPASTQQPSAGSSASRARRRKKRKRKRR